MAFTSPPTAVTGAVIEAADINVFRDNDNWFNALMPAPTGANQLHVSSSTSAATWTSPNGDAVLTPATVTGNSGSSAIGTGTVHANRLVAGSFDETQVDAAFAAGAIDADRLKSASLTATQLADLAVTTAKINDLAVTAAKIAAQTITASQIANNTIGNSQLVGGTAVANLGFTPSRIISGTYSGTGATSARQITTGFAVKFVIIHQPSADVMYVAINTTSSLRLGPSPTFVQGSASVHTHASDGFVVSDGSVQGNVAGSDNYSYTAFG